MHEMVEITVLLDDYWNSRTSLAAQRVKRLSAMQETRVRSLGQEGPLEKGKATHSRTLVWKISWTEEPRRLQFLVSQRTGHDWATSLSHLISVQGESLHSIRRACEKEATLDTITVWFVNLTEQKGIPVIGAILLAAHFFYREFIVFWMTLKDLCIF